MTNYRSFEELSSKEQTVIIDYLSNFKMSTHDYIYLMSKIKNKPFIVDIKRKGEIQI